MTQNQKQEENVENTQDPLEYYGNIIAKLRNYYDDLQKEEVPEKFLHLLERLEQAELKEGKNKQDQDVSPVKESENNEQ
ncbi:NepR family anti-sigma factor [Bartonella sp. DGB1]|uniref:NepR family anti-sigma factor n=1 Tax=Bartonella sp. DGB1 TaxID=3239807 RepID=UPI003525A9EB